MASFVYFSFFSQCKDKYSTNFDCKWWKHRWCLGLEPGATGWKALTNPLSYGGTLTFLLSYCRPNLTRSNFSFVISDWTIISRRISKNYPALHSHSTKTWRSSTTLSNCHTRTQRSTSRSAQAPFRLHAPRRLRFLASLVSSTTCTTLLRLRKSVWSTITSSPWPLPMNPDPFLSSTMTVTQSCKASFISGHFYILSFLLYCLHFRDSNQQRNEFPASVNIGSNNFSFFVCNEINPPKEVNILIIIFRTRWELSQPDSFTVHQKISPKDVPVTWIFSNKV